MTTSTVLITRIEQAFFEAVRLRVVEDGYTPDITAYPNTPAGYQAYKQALADIKANRGWAVEVFGMGNPKSKGIKQIPRIVFFTDSFVQGDYGLDQATFYEPGGSGKFKAVTPLQNIAQQLFLKCYIVAETTSQYRYLASVINTTLPIRGMLSYAAPLEGAFFTETTAFLDLSSTTDGLIEKAYTYSVPDILWTENATVLEAAVPINYINLNLQLVKELGVPGEWPDDPNDYINTEIWIPEEFTVSKYLVADNPNSNGPVKGFALVTGNDEAIILKQPS